MMSRTKTAKVKYFENADDIYSVCIGYAVDKLRHLLRYSISEPSKYTFRSSCLLRHKVYAEDGIRSVDVVVLMATREIRA